MAVQTHTSLTAARWTAVGDCSGPQPADGTAVRARTALEALMSAAWVSDDREPTIPAHAYDRGLSSVRGDAFKATYGYDASARTERSCAGAVCYVVRLRAGASGATLAGVAARVRGDRWLADGCRLSASLSASPNPPPLALLMASTLHSGVLCVPADADPSGKPISPNKREGVEETALVDCSALSIPANSMRWLVLCLYCEDYLSVRGAWVEGGAMLLPQTIAVEADGLATGDDDAFLVGTGDWPTSPREGAETGMEAVDRVVVSDPSANTGVSAMLLLPHLYSRANVLRADYFEGRDDSNFAIVGNTPRTTGFDCLPRETFASLDDAYTFPVSAGGLTLRLGVRVAVVAGDDDWAAPYATMPRGLGALVVAPAPRAGLLTAVDVPWTTDWSGTKGVRAACDFSLCRPGTMVGLWVSDGPAPGATGGQHRTVVDVRKFPWRAALECADGISVPFLDIGARATPDRSAPEQQAASLAFRLAGCFRAEEGESTGEDAGAADANFWAPYYRYPLSADLRRGGMVIVAAWPTQLASAAAPSTFPFAFRLRMRPDPEARP